MNKRQKIKVTGNNEIRKERKQENKRKRAGK